MLFITETRIYRRTIRRTLIDSELCEYENWNRTNVQSTSDCNEDNSVEHQAEITTQETNEVISGDCLEWSEEEEKLFARTLFWTNEPVTSRKSYYLRINQLQKILTK